MESLLDIRMGEFFCGPGGITHGLDLASASFGDCFRVEHVWANDFDRDTCDTYASNIDVFKGHVLCKDVRTLDISSVERFGSINAFSFGFPCNDYSVVGECKGMQGTYGPRRRVLHGAVIEAPDTDPYREGYEFVRWSGYEEGITVSGDMRFEAVFE